MTRHLLILSLSFFIPALTFAGPLYILFDNDCMDVFEYEFQNKDAGDNYDAYHIKVNDTEKVIFEVNPDSYRYQNYLPAQYISCQNAVFDKRLVAQINRSVDEVYIIQKKGRKKYYLLPVIFAAFFKNDNGDIDFASPKYQFRFNTQTGTIGEDVSFNNPKAAIFFEAKLENECSGAFLLRQNVKDQPKGLTYLLFVPEIGIVEERNGSNSLEALENTVKLEKVNDKSFNSHLKDICKEPRSGEIGNLVLSPIISANDDKFEKDNFDRPTLKINDEFAERGVDETEINIDPILDYNQSTENNTVSAYNSNNGNRYHIVRKGETLYRISKKYNISVGEIKAWNKLSSNTIYRNDQLLVSEPSTQPKTALPAPYEQTTEKGIPKWHTTSGLHTVKNGETVAYVAMLYGFTEKRFREINSLKTNEVVRLGQVLKTQDCEPCPDLSQDKRPNAYEKDIYQADVTPKTGENQFLNNPSRNTPVFYDQPESGNYRTTKGSAVRVDPQLSPKGYEGATQRINTRPSGQRASHVVKDGDTLFSLALQYNVTVEHLRRINNMEVNEILIPHQKIYID